MSTPNLAHPRATGFPSTPEPKKPAIQAPVSGPVSAPIPAPVSGPDPAAKKGKKNKPDSEPSSDPAKPTAADAKTERFPRVGPELAERLSVAVQLGELDSYSLYHLLTEIFRSPKNAAPAMTLLSIRPNPVDLRDPRYTFSAVSETRKKVREQLQNQEVV